MTLPTIKVELGRLTGWVLGESLLGTDTFLATYTYEDITSRIMDVSIRRGRQHELDRIEAGTATLTALNQDGALTPTNTASVYYPDIRPMAPIRITAEFTEPFSPTHIAGLRIWADVSQMPVVADGTAIGSFTDFSGNGNHFTQATGANQPTYQSGIFNGKPVLRFDGSNDRMDVTGTADASQTIFIVAEKRSAPTTAFHTLFNLSSLNKAQLGTLSTTDATKYVFFNGGFLVVSGTATDTSIAVLKLTSVAVLDMWVNGVAGATNSVDPDDSMTTTTMRSLCWDSSAGNFGDYDVAEYIEYDTALASADMNTLGSYLGTKYGITWTTIP